MAQPLLPVVQALMNPMTSTVLAVTDLTSASYKLVGFATMVAGPPHGEVILVSTYGGRGIESRFRREGQLLERQRQWCADRGVRCRAELYEDGVWQEFVVQSARRSQADLILVGVQLLIENGEFPPGEMRKLAQNAPCPVSVVRLPPLSVF